MPRINARSALLAGVGLTCLLAASTGQAQTAAPAADSGTLSEVVVTATKRSENIQNVPISVSVVSQKALTSQNLADTTDLKRLVPGLQFTPASTVGNAIFVVRGVGTAANGNGLEQSVGVSYDGVPLGRSLGSISDLVDIARVEVLKGPQGMLLGKNASAGVINVISQQPKLGVTEENARLAYGTLNYIQATGTVNVPLGDNAALRISAWKFQHDGFVREANTGQEMGDKNTQGARFRLRLKPIEGLDLNFSTEFTSHNQNGGAITIRSFTPGNFTAGNKGALVQAWEIAHGTVASPSNRTARGVVSKYGYYDRGSTASYIGQADYSLGGGVITAIGSYRRVGNDNPFDPFPTDNPYNTAAYNRDENTYSQETGEVRYASPAADRLHFVAGLFYFHLNLRERFLVAQAGSTPTPVNDYWNFHVRNDNVAAFGEATFNVTPQLHLIAGVRQSRDAVSGSMDRGFLIAPSATITGFNTPGSTFGVFQTSNSTTYNDTSWRAGLQYQIRPSAMVYATASRGYKGPGLAYGFTSSKNGLAAANNGLVKPEIAHLYEAGLKSQWFDRHLTVNMAVFDETFTNFQTSVRVPGPVLAFVTQNAKELKSDGVDLDVNWVVTPELSLMLSENYDNARYTDYKNAACYTGEQSTSTPTSRTGVCVLNASGAQDHQNLTGWALANSPKWTTNVTARYERPLSSKFRWYVQANDAYRSDVVFNTTRDPKDHQGAYSVVNLTAGIDTTDGRWSLSFYGNNVNNAQFVDRIQASAGGAIFSEQFLSYADLRTFGVSLSGHF